MGKSELEKEIDQLVTKYREYLEKFLEDDTDDFTGMHTKEGIPVDGFYGMSYQLIRDLNKLLAQATKKAEVRGRIDEIHRLHPHIFTSGVGIEHTVINADIRERLAELQESEGQG